jgi:hypothetical protein
MRYRFAGGICGLLSRRKHIGDAFLGVGSAETRF